MEYKIFRALRHGIQIPLFIRFILGVFLIFVSSFPLILPLFPGSWALWLVMFLIWVMLIVPWHKVRHVIKLRKWLVYISKNLHKKHFHRNKHLDYKIRDIKAHIKEILKG